MLNFDVEMYIVYILSVCVCLTIEMEIYTHLFFLVTYMNINFNKITILNTKCDIEQIFCLQPFAISVKKNMLNKCS